MVVVAAATTEAASNVTGAVSSHERTAMRGTFGVGVALALARDSVWHHRGVLTPGNHDTQAS